MKNFAKKVFIIFFIATFLNHLITPSFSYTGIPNFLLELGIKDYEDGNYNAALSEFNKVLLVEPGHELAKEYIKKIRGTVDDTQKETAPSPQHEKLSGELLREQEGFVEKASITVPSPPVSKKTLLPQTRFDQPKEYTTAAAGKEEKKKVIDRLYLDRGSLELIFMPIKIEEGRSIIIEGNNIIRFLEVTPNIINAEKMSRDEIQIIGKNIGFTYLHIWDKNGRWTVYFQGLLPKPTGPTLEEEMRLAEQRASTFKLRYSTDWFLFEEGRRLNSLDRQSYSYGHSFSLTGETPYGNFAGDAQIRTSQETTDLTYLSLRLRDGRFGPFEDFNLRGFDFGLPFSNLAYGGAGLRGIMLESPAFDKKINYTVFWGREGGGRYGGLSPGLLETKDSFLRGLDINYLPSENLDYGFSYFYGWGADREEYLNPQSYDGRINYHFPNLDLGYEISNDSKKYAHLIKSAYSLPKLKLTAEFRDIDKDFKSITGFGWHLGEIGGLFTAHYLPFATTRIFSRLDVYKDRLFPNPDKGDRLNLDYSVDLTQDLTSSSVLRLDYNIQDEQGNISPRRFQATGVSLNKSYDFMKGLSLYLGYRNSISTNFTSPSLDYKNDKLSTGLRLNLIGNLYYYLNKEVNWLEETFTGIGSRPEALEMGFDWYYQVFDSPFYSTMRIAYRDEEDAFSSVSFLSGEDYIEGYGEISYHPNPDTEMYFSTRVRNVWADSPIIDKRVEFELRTGLRYLFDTGWSWSSVGSIEGCVFNDLNSDAIRQSNEPGMEDVKLYLGKDMVQVSDSQGYYQFKKVRAKKVSIAIDPSTLPPGFVLTTSEVREVDIIHNRTARLDFGVVSRSDITGIVFEDLNANGKFDFNDKGIGKVIITLDDGQVATTNGAGSYIFRNVAVGDHTLFLDINSVPLYLLPQVPLIKKITLFEGLSYQHNIPLRKGTD
ncbi:MAG: SdrD B-like domain-containing protein [Candidatus Omnitrophota bacterium]